MIRNILILCIIAVTVSRLNCVTLDEAAENPLKGYVLTSANGTNVTDSGVRLGPLDFKYETVNHLKKYGLNSTLIKKFVPYIGLSGIKAENALVDVPLNVTESEYDSIVLAFKNYYLPKVNQVPKRIRRNKKVSIFVIDFCLNI